MKGSPIPTTAPAESNGECVLVRPTFSLLDTYKSTIFGGFSVWSCLLLRKSCRIF